MSDTDEARVPEPAVLRSMFEIVTATSRTGEEFRKLLLSGRAGRPNPEVPAKAPPWVLFGRIDPPSWSQG